jgi:hypothetical protein
MSNDRPVIARWEAFDSTLELASGRNRIVYNSYSASCSCTLTKRLALHSFQKLPEPLSFGWVDREELQPKVVSIPPPDFRQFNLDVSFMA